MASAPEDEPKDWSQIKMERANLPKAKPSLTSATGIKNVDDLPSNYGIIIDIPSVAYLKSDETPRTVYCAIFLQLTFRLDSVLEKADLPFEVIPTMANKPDVTGKSTKWPWDHHRSKSSKPPVTEEEQPLQFDVPFWFPNREEKAPTGSYTARQTLEIKPNLGVPTPVGAASFGGVGTTRETSSTKDALIFRWGAREYNSDTLVKLRWDASAEPPPFTFKLNLLRSLKVTSRATPFFARGAPGWEFLIRGNYQPTIVDNMLRAYKEKSSEYEDITLVKLAQAHTEFVPRDA